LHGLDIANLPVHEKFTRAGKASTVGFRFVRNDPDLDANLFAEVETDFVSTKVGDGDGEESASYPC